MGNNGIHYYPMIPIIDLTNLQMDGGQGRGGQGGVCTNVHAALLV